MKIRCNVLNIFVANMFKQRLISSLLVLLLLGVATSVNDDDLVVTLPNGKIRGHLLRSEIGYDYRAFQEIPYASPPVGELRFKPPIPPKNWDGILETQENTKICYQPDSFLAPNATQTEDCLYLNVYTPQVPYYRSTLLPVFVWIHGGGFVTGSGTFQQVGPKFIIDSNNVIVAINYRLGPLGFLTTQDGVIPASLGLKDQNLALKWVKENIELFGGDPEKVTIGGESAGAISVGYHILSKQSKGLFRAAILESGTALVPLTDQKISRRAAFAVGKALDPSFDSDDSEELLALLQSASAIDIINTNIILPENLNSDSPWAPVIEDETIEGAFLTGPFDEDIKNGNINRVPILIGFNSEETKLFAAQDLNGFKQRGVQYDEDIKTLLEGVFNIQESNKVKAGTELKQIYTNTTFQDNFVGLVSYLSDYIFTTPASRHADIQSQYTDVYLYLFSYKGNLGYIGYDTDVVGLDPNGVAHGEDLGYIWDMGFNSDSSKYSEADILTRNRILKLWSNFIRHLDPTPVPDSLFQNKIWPKVKEGTLNYLNINATLEIGVDPRRYKEWKEIVDAYAIPPYTIY